LEEALVTNGDSGQMFNYPLSRPTALESPAEWVQLRQQCPVARVKLPSGDEALLLTRYDDVRQVLSDPRFYRPSNADDAARIQTSESGGIFNNKERTAIPQRGEGHQRLRRMIGKWFTVKRINALRSGIEAMAERLVDDMVKQGQPADLQANVGLPLPLWAICDMLGVPDSDRDKVSHWSYNDAQPDPVHPGADGRVVCRVHRVHGRLHRRQTCGAGR
jgi:cytochrome P450